MIASPVNPFIRPLLSVIACAVMLLAMLVAAGCDGQGVEGEPLPDEPLPDGPTFQVKLLRPLPDATFRWEEGMTHVWEEGMTLDLRHHFARSDGGPLTFDANVATQSGAADAVTAEVEGGHLLIVPQGGGTNEVRVTASDGAGAELSDTLSAQVLAHPLAGSYSLVSALNYWGEWAFPSLEAFTSGCLIWWITGGTLEIGHNGSVARVNRIASSCAGPDAPPPLNTGTPSEEAGRFSSDTSGWLVVEGNTFTVRALGDTLELIGSRYSHDRYRYVGPR